MVGGKWSEASPVAGEVLASQLEIVSVEAAAVELNLAEPMTIAFGTYDSRPSGWMAVYGLVDGEMRTGFGEGATLPEAVFTDDSGHNIAANMTELAGALDNREDRTVRGAIEEVRRHTFGDGGSYPTARLATEMAILDLASKAHGVSVRDVIGVPASVTEVPYGKSIGGTSAGRITDQAEAALRQHAQKIKVKVSPALFGEVIEALSGIRQAHPDVDLMVDANGSFDPTDMEHLGMLSVLDGAGLMMIEEPVSRVGSERGLQAVRVLKRELPDIATPICLDDCLRTDDDCTAALDEGLAKIINVKPGRIGSFVRALGLVDRAAASGAEVMVGGMLEATPGRCMTTILAAYCLHRGFSVPGDLSLAQERLTSDLVPADRQLSLSPSGNIVVPSGPGWGF